MLWKCCTQYASKFGKLSRGHMSGRSVFIPVSKKGNARECSNYRTIVLISHTSKVMLKFSKLGFNGTWAKNFQIFKLGLEKTKEREIANIYWVIKKAREFQKNIYFCFIDYTKEFMWITTKCGTFLKRTEYQTTLSASWEICMQVRKQQLKRTGHGTMDGLQIGKE